MRRWIAIWGLVALGGCARCGQAPAPTTPADSGVERSQIDESIKPNYDSTAPILPLAKQLCDALWVMPETRRAECCHASPRIDFSVPCAHELSAAVAGGGLALDPEGVPRCLADLEKAYAGCGWEESAESPMPASCLAALQPKLHERQRCGSSLECPSGLRCLGSGPTDHGVCGPPAAVGKSCDTAVDALAPVVKHPIDTEHPGCVGYCDHHICRAPHAAGGECFASWQCESGLLCKQKKCTAGPRTEAGQPCTSDECAEGLRCQKGACVAPKKSGEVCDSPFECAGSCVRTDGGPSHCGPRCL